MTTRRPCAKSTNTFLFFLVGAAKFLLSQSIFLRLLYLFHHKFHLMYIYIDCNSIYLSIRFWTKIHWKKARSSHNKILALLTTSGINGNNRKPSGTLLQIPFYSLYHIIVIHIQIRILQLQLYYNGTLFVRCNNTYIPKGNQIFFCFFLSTAFCT